MVKITGSVTPSEHRNSGTDEHAQVQELLNSASWQERLEKARLKRLQVLADRGEPTARPSMPEGMPLPMNERARDLAATSLRSQRGRSGDRPRPATTAPENSVPPPATLPVTQPAPASGHSSAQAVHADAVVAKLHHARSTAIASLPPVDLPQLSPASPDATLRAEIIGVDAVIRAEMPAADFADLAARVRLRKRVLAGVIGGAFAVGLGLGFGVKPFLPAADPGPAAEPLAAATPPVTVASADPPAAVAEISPPALPAAPEAEPPQVTFTLTDADALAAQMTAWTPLPAISHVVDLSAAGGPRPAAPAVPQADSAASAAGQPATLPIVQAAAPAHIPPLAPESRGTAPVAETAFSRGLRSAPGPATIAQVRETAFLPPEPAPAAPAAATAAAPVVSGSIAVFAPASLDDSVLASAESQLSAAGHPVDRTTRVDFKVSATHVRYYHAEDADLARAVAAEIGGKARDFTASDSNSPPGTIELWLAGTSAGAANPAPPVKTRPAPKKTAAKAPAPAPKPAPPPMTKAQQIEALRSSLIERLKTADSP